MTTEDDRRSYGRADELSLDDSGLRSAANAARSFDDSAFQILLDKGRHLESPSSTRRGAAPLTPQALKRIPAGESPHSVAVSPDGRHIYVTNFRPGTVSVVDPNLEEVVATIEVVRDPYGVVASPNGTSLYVSSPSAKRFDRVMIPGAATPPDIDIQTGISRAPYGIAISQDASRIYAAAALEDAIVILDALTKEVGDLDGSIDFPVGVALSPDGSRLYASSFFHATVKVIDLSQATVIHQVDVAMHPYGLAVSKEGNRLFVTHFPDGNVSVVDLDSSATVATIPVEDGPRGIAISPDGRDIYVTNMFADSVSVIRL